MARKNLTYSKELILEVVHSYLAGEGTMNEIAKKYGVKNVSQVTVWVKKYKEVSSIEAFQRLTSTGFGAKGVKNPLKGKRIHFKSVEEERDYYKAQVEYLKSSIQICKGRCTYGTHAISSLMKCERNIQLRG